MKRFKGDIDIDVSNRDAILAKFKHVKASIVNKNGEESGHNVGIYVQDVPCNPVTGRATFEYQVAEELGYYKVDVLNNSIYDDVEDMQHLEQLCDDSMVHWDLLEHESIVEQMPQLSGHYDVVSKICPRSVDELAIVLALIRPAKRHLVDEPMYVIEEQIWEKPSGDGYYYKKSHAISYALSLVVKMNLMVETIF